MLFTNSQRSISWIAKYVLKSKRSLRSNYQPRDERVIFKNYIKRIWYSYCDSWLRAIRKNALQKSSTKKEGPVVNAKRFPLSCREARSV